MVRHLESLVAEKYGGGSSNNDVAQPVGRKIQASNDGRRGKEERHTRLKLKAAFFYAEDGMVASIDPWWIHTTFNLLTGLFDRVGLKTNVKKKMEMVCHPFRADGVKSEEACDCHMMGEGMGYK